MNLTIVNGTIFFTADDGIHGREVWKSDGTEEGTVMVKDINPYDDCDAENLTNVNGTLLFTANDSTGNNLWMSDGTEGGTATVNDILRDISAGLIDVNGTLFFIADYLFQGPMLCKSDGTEAGTVAIKEVDPSNGSDIGNMTDVNGTLFFTADDGHETKLWKSDGTEAGTVVIKAIDSSYGGLYNLTNVGGTLFFTTNHGDYGRQLWKSDGTEAGTVIIKLIDPEPSPGFFPKDLTAVNGVLFFTGNDGAHGIEIWKSDGTAAGTFMVKDICPNSYPENLIDVNGTLFFTADDGEHGNELWKSDGTEAGTCMVKDINLSGGSYLTSLFNVNGTLFFSVSEGLWKSDGNEAGTVMVKDIELSRNNPTGLCSFNETFYFSASGGLWKSDGTEDGTVMVKQIGPNAGSSPGNLTSITTTLFFSVGSGLWKSDGTEAGTVMVKDIYSASLQELADVNGMLFFAAFRVNPFISSHYISDAGLWKSDGTEAGTVMIKAFDPSYGGVYNLTNVSGTLFFTTNHGDYGGQLWKSDGTESGSAIIYTYNSGPENLTAINGTLFFTADDSIHGRELWKSDGTEAGTVMVKNIAPDDDSSPYDGSPENLTDVKGTLFFTADDGIRGRELWKSDGTEGGTVMVKDIDPSAGSDPEDLTNVNGTLFFSASDGFYGHALWKSDGTEAGTTMVKNVDSSIDSYPSNLTNVNGTLFFAADISLNDGIIDYPGRALWKSDGTENGTVLVKIFDPSVADSAVFLKNLTCVNEMLFFTAYNPSSDIYELWKTDGTAENTTLVSSQEFIDSDSLTDSDGLLFFVADDGRNGTELWISAPDYPLYTLTVFVKGTGSGSIVSLDGGIDCGFVCSKRYPEGTTVTLTAALGNDSFFTGWSGDESGTDQTLFFTLSQNMEIAAEFSQKSGGGCFIHSLLSP